MIRFDFFRKKLTSFSLAALFAAGVAVSVPQASFANDWMDMLKPLVKDVIVPGASMGMKKLIQREERLHPELAKFNSGSTGYTNTTSNVSGAVDDFFNNSASSSTSSTTSSANEFASPEEPISSSNVSGSVVGADFWSSSTSASASDPAPAPPPPVATP